MDNSIPRVIHQTWKTDRIPSQWEPLRDTWRRLNPQWEYRLWTDEDNVRLIAEHYPWFLQIFEGYDRAIKRPDSVRYFIMHHHGGVYVDLDFEALRPIDGLLAGEDLVLGWEPSEHVEREAGVRSRGLTSIVGNAFLASRPAHPFWEAVFEALVSHHNMPSVLDATGPFLLTHVYHDYAYSSRPTIAPSEMLYPVTKWDAWSGVLERDRSRETLPKDAYAVHHWNGMYRREELIDLVRRRLGRSS